MAKKIQFRRGTYANLPSLNDGEPGWCTDECALYVGQDGTNYPVVNLSALGIDADLLTLTVPTSTTISDFGKTLVDDASASAALTTLGVSAYAKTILDDAAAVNARATLGMAAKYIGDYASLAAAIAAISSTSCTLIIDTNQSVAADLTIPVTLSVVVRRGTVITVASGMTLTINGPFEAPPCQVFAGDGSVVFGTGYVDKVYPQWWPDCLPDGTTDCGPAFQKAVDACPQGGTVWISRGKWKISTTIEVSTAAAKAAGYTPQIVHFKGEGPHSVLWVDDLAGYNAIEVGPSYDPATEIDAPTNYLYGLDWRDFSILGGSACCQSGLLIQCTVNSKFRNINFYLGATRAALELDWILVCDFDIVNSWGAGFSFLPYVPSAPAVGILGHICTGSGGQSVFNANRFYVCIEGCTGKGMSMSYYSTCGKDEISGMIQSVTDYGLELYGGRCAHIHDLYMEAGGAGQNELVLNEHDYGYIGPRVTHGTPAEDQEAVILEKCDYTTINGLMTGRLYIDADCNGTNVQDIWPTAAVGSALITDLGTRTQWHQYVTGSETWDPASMDADATLTNAITCSGATLGMVAGVAPPYTLSGVVATAYVSDTDEVTVVLHNVTSGAVNLGSGTWKVWAKRI